MGEQLFEKVNGLHKPFTFFSSFSFLDCLLLVLMSLFTKGLVPNRFDDSG